MFMITPFFSLISPLPDVFLVFLHFTAIQTHSPFKPALVFVSSRRQTRLTALDLIAFLATSENPKQWLHMDEAEVSPITIVCLSYTFAY